MIETIELTPAVVGLGNLHEPALLALVADTHYRVLTHGRSVTPREITNKNGEALYPSVFALHVQIPAARPLDSHALWRRFDLGVDVRAFGRQFLETTSVLASPGELPEDATGWSALDMPRVTWSSAWTVTRPGGEHELSMANSELLAELPRLPKVPAGIAAARDVYARGRVWADTTSAMTVSYPVLAGRDAAPGRQMMFSQFIVVLDAIERAFLGERIAPAFPVDVLDHMSTRERRVFYFGNCSAGDVIDARVTAKLSRSTPMSVRTEIELVDARTRRLVAIADVEKAVTVPPSRAALNQDVERLLSRHGDGTPLVEMRR